MIGRPGKSGMPLMWSQCAWVSRMTLSRPKSWPAASGRVRLGPTADGLSEHDPMYEALAAQMTRIIALMALTAPGLPGARRSTNRSTTSRSERYAALPYAEASSAIRSG